jgi:dienelactone hydrolase
MIIMLAVSILEISFALFSIITKSHYPKEKSILRIIYAVVFLILVVSPVIDWGFRYYAICFVLILLAIISVIHLIRRKGHTREYRALCALLKAFGIILIVFTSSIPLLLFPYPKEIIETTGIYQVLTQDYTYTDESRVESYTDSGEKRRLNVQFWYPNTNKGESPLILFSHGGLGIKSSNESLFSELASHGYIVCSIDHTYQCLYTTDEDGATTWIDLGYMRELFKEDPRSNIELSYEYYQKWMNIRTQDINVVLDTIISKVSSENDDKVYSLVDISKIGVMGHSLGGSAAHGIGRIREDVLAIITLESPFMCDILGIEEGEFIFENRMYPLPILNIYSDSAWNILAKRVQYKANYTMLNERNPTTYNLYISDIGHLGLTDFGLTSPFLTRIIDRKKSTIEQQIDSLKKINMVCLEFFNIYLKDEEQNNPDRLISLDFFNVK